MYRVAIIRKGRLLLGIQFHILRKKPYNLVEPSNRLLPVRCCFDMKLQHLFSIVLVLVFGIHSLWGQGAIDGYMKGRGNTDVAVSYAREGYDVYNFGAEPRPVDIRINSIGFFIEHGVNDSIDLVFTTAYLDLDPQNRGIQDAILALKYRNQYRKFRNGGSWTTLTAVGLGFPLGGYSTETTNPIGERALSFQARLVGQYQSPNGVFAQLQSGFDFRIEPQNLFAVPVLVRAGWAGRFLYADAWLERYQTLNSGTNTQIAGGEGSSWWKVGSTLYVPISGSFGVVANVARILGGENIGESTRLGGGVVVRL